MKNKKEFMPILLIPAVPHKNGIRFLCPTRQLDVKGEIVADIWGILSLCNGHRTVQDIAHKSKLELSFVEQVLDDLSKLDIVNDSREQYRHFHTISSNPQIYLNALTRKEIRLYREEKRKPVKSGKIIDFKLNSSSALYQLQCGRKSCRNFSETKLPTLSLVGNICNYAYSLSRHATPSGGALFPLKIYCVVMRNLDMLEAGYYEYDAEHDHLVLYNLDIDLEHLQYCYGTDSLAFNSPVQIIIGADLNRQPYKYSNHGYRLTLIEVGHVAQNISLYCQEQGLATCELGGILDVPLAMELGLEKDAVSPILAIAVGYKSETCHEQSLKYSDLLEYLESKIVGESCPVLEYGINSFDAGEGTFYGAWANYGRDGNHIAGATGLTFYEAACKAIIEGYERFQSGKIRVDYVGPMDNTGLFYKPNEIAPLSQEQRCYSGLLPYCDGDTIEWTKDMTGKYYLPSDYIFYGHSKKEKLFHSNSSGVAAYFNYEQAQERALAELIERDAVMRSWYQQKAPKHVRFEFLPQHVKNRIEYWEQKGRRIHILDLESQYLPVFLVAIVSNQYPCFISGAAAIFGEVTKAMSKALQEAEYNLLLALRNPIGSPFTKDEIRTPFDHGHYYHFPNNLKKISWLWSNCDCSDSFYNIPPDVKSLITALDVIFVDLSESPTALIKVVRAISKKMIPISFGYRRDYYLHPEIQKLNISPVTSKLPHYFA